MINNVEEYLRQLRQELSGSDKATIQDALSDAEEHLRNAIAGNRETAPAMLDSEALLKIIEEYGTPAEVAAAYKKMEKHASPSLAVPALNTPASIWYKLFGILADPRAWGALFYLLISLATGIIYFTWAITGLSVSAGLMVLVIGLPLFTLFILSVRGIALIEGRLVEALLGIRMPHRPFFYGSSTGLWGRFKALFSDRRTWLSLLYMILQMPLGITYFAMFISLIAVSVGLMLEPVIHSFFGSGVFTIGYHNYYPPMWLWPFSLGVGILLFLGTMHLAGFVGKLHGKFAKLMLVRE